MPLVRRPNQDFGPVAAINQAAAYDNVNVALQFVKGTDGWAVIGVDFFVLADTKEEALQKYNEAVAASTTNGSASSQSDDDN